MVVVARNQVVRFLIFLLVIVGLVWYVVAKRPEFNRAVVVPPGGAPSLPTASPMPMEPRLGQEREFFADYRVDRDRSRAQQLELLERLAVNQQADADSRKEAGRTIVSIGQRIGQETQLEGLLKAKGYQDVVVFVHGQSAEVVLRVSRDLDRAELAAIAELASRATGIKAQYLSIIPRP